MESARWDLLNKFLLVGRPSTFGASLGHKYVCNHNLFWHMLSHHLDHDKICRQWDSMSQKWQNSCYLNNLDKRNVYLVSFWTLQAERKWKRKCSFYPLVCIFGKSFLIPLCVLVLWHRNTFWLLCKIWMFCALHDFHRRKVFICSKLLSSITFFSAKW